MYSYYNNGRFSFPPNFDFNIIPGKDCPATVISVIGESDLFSLINKMAMFEDLTSSSMKPMNIIPPFRNDFSTEQSSSYLSGFYCESQKIVFIHLRSLNDSDLLLNTNKSIRNEKIKENFFDIEDSVYLKFVLYLFLLSDFILISIIGLNFDPFYVTLFSQINILRKKFKSMTENELKTISNSAEVTNNGRLVQPRLLFVFNPVQSPITNALKQKSINIENLREKIEEKLYAVLKYHNICGSEYSLAKLQTNSPFVFIRLPLETEMGCFDTFGDLLARFVDSGCQLRSLTIDNDDREKQSRSFEKFIFDQIHTFSIRRESSGFGSENISCRNWFKACHKLYNLFCSEKCRFNETLSSHRYTLFKKGCELALAIAETHYKDGLPSQYSRDIHSNRAKEARQILLSIAKGPTLLSSIKALEENLNKVWAVGRQMCEAISVTRQRCKHEVHLLPISSNEDDEDEDEIEGNDIEDCEDVNNEELQECSNNDSSNSSGKKLPRMKHCSEVQLVSACNCGRRQSTRRDPFDYKEANWVFYEQMSELCCFRFARVPLPESIPIAPSVSPATLGRHNDRLEESMGEALSDMSERELVLSQSLLPRTRRVPDASWSSGGGEDENDFDNDDENDEENEEDEEEEEEAEEEQREKEKEAEENPSGEKPQQLPQSVSLVDNSSSGNNRKTIFSGMFTTSSDRRSMPRYPSWQLLDSGPYFSYTHSSGLEYSGFVHGSNYLLPWDVPLKTRINKVRKQRVKRAFAAGNFVKAFLGFEMECPVGHRFFLAGPDNMMAGSMASHQVKEAVSGLLTRDIPLYFPCQCSTYLAQLMRVYVAVPNSNLLRVFLQPRVRPGPVEETPVFTPGSDCPIELEPGHLWVLRLPFAYEHDGHIYRQQADMRAVEQCKLLKESIFYEEVLDYDE